MKKEVIGTYIDHSSAMVTVYSDGTYYCDAWRVEETGKWKIDEYGCWFDRGSGWRPVKPGRDSQFICVVNTYFENMLLGE